MALQSMNPTNGGVIARYEEASDTELSQALGRVTPAFADWRTRSFAERGGWLRAAATELRGRAAGFARLMALEMGKPLAQGRAEVEKCAWVCDYFAEQAEGFLADQPIATEWRRSYAAFQPLGAILAVMPWNFPFWQVFRAAAPALMAGNVMLLKHASNVTGCALAIAAVFERAGFPPGVFQVLRIGAQSVGAVIDHDAVRAVTLTGSTPAGRAVAAIAGRALKKTVLELGGSDPYVVLEDADLEAAAEACVTARLINTGQSCIAAKRFIVVADVRHRFEELVVERMRSRRVGDPLQEDVDLGPMARVDLRDGVHCQVVASRDAGARVLLGGAVPEEAGAFYPPTVLTDVRPGMPAFDEETFGPVAAIVAAPNEAAAIDLANATPFGLGAAVFTRDLERGERLARERLEAGCCFVNAFVRSDPRLPFGGVRLSGYGRELGLLGMREFVNAKSVCVA
ncbi:MAG: NAD-dependent succinate-semialdehyde dehydrogenase [Verrucomicrobiae bacterium]|nr:NAD-dependent succinate-semialdehyde dehydrogenase [Verrucomicrobiae bacterium]MCP5524220.1 NAD-dependent succinate-semialdehyde dehydrogenase [Verrucomicrobiales bacterium]